MFAPWIKKVTPGRHFPCRFARISQQSLFLKGEVKEFKVSKYFNFLAVREKLGLNVVRFSYILGGLEYGSR